MKSIIWFLLLFLSVNLVKAETKNVGFPGSIQKSEIRPGKCCYNTQVNSGPIYIFIMLGDCCFHLYRIAEVNGNIEVTPMNSTNYVGTTMVCGEGSGYATNMC